MPPNKKPWWLEPSRGPRQAYAAPTTDGTPMIRQSLRTADGRVCYLEMTPAEAASLIADLDESIKAIGSGLFGTAIEYPEARF